MSPQSMVNRNVDTGGPIQEGPSSTTSSIQDLSQHGPPYSHNTCSSDMLIHDTWQMPCHLHPSFIPSYFIDSVSNITDNFLESA